MTNSGVRHAVIKITGRVQGVFFRAAAKREADRLDLSGRVRNEPDGSVYIEASGSEDALNEFIAWCRHGPPMAGVAHMDVTYPDTGGATGDFVIAR